MIKLAVVLGTAVLVLAGITVAVADQSPSHGVQPRQATPQQVPPAHAGSAHSGSAPPVGHPIPQTRISIVSSNVPVSGGVAHVRLSCQMGEAIRLTCQGVLSLQALGAGGSGRLLGQGRFAIANCCSAPWHTVSVHLNQAGRGALRATPVRVRAHAVLDKNAASGTRVVSLVRGG
ncbi:MAG: hypothetical protein JO027_02635 [Solirubrobacterales bacterium]|nr:hypothetical protein [Solirubrobacterales bacterium]